MGIAADFDASGFTGATATFATAAALGAVGAGAAFATGGLAGALTGATAAFTAGLTGAFTAVFETGAFEPEGFATEAFEPEALEPEALEPEAFEDVFEPAALGATFAVLFGISLLFFEDATVLPILRGSLSDARERAFVALRRAATADFTVFDFEDEVFDLAAVVFAVEAFVAEALETGAFADLETLFLRVF